MGLEALKKFFLKELEDWQITAMIYRVSEPIQGIKEPTPEEQEIINKIGKMRKDGKLNDQQIEILDRMQWFRIDGSDEF